MIQQKASAKKRKKKPAVRFDLLWKELLESFFYAALEVFYPSLYQASDHSRKPVFLNKELRIPGMRKGYKILDLLVDVPLKTGETVGVLLHLELQGEIRGESFHVRMYKYSCLITLRLGRPFTALAIRITPKGKFEEVRYESRQFETRIAYDYRTVFLDQLDEERLLEMEGNPVAVAVAAAIRMQKAGKNEKQRFEYGREMVHLLKSRGYPSGVRQKVIQFITEIANLSAEKLLVEFNKEIDDLFEEVESMPITSPMVEEVLKKKSYRRGKADGKREGKLEGRLEGRLEGQKKTALLMLSDRMAPDLISKFTGLSVKEIQDLRG
jgi:predicted transposase YdaD